jgi:YhcH/YjgK/YiaL family protein
MILDHIRHASCYSGVTPGMRRALEYLAHTDSAVLAPGRYDIDGDRVFALVQRYDTKPHDQGVWEAHRRYIDVQFMVAGHERMGYAPLTSLTVTHPYAPDTDCEVLTGNGDVITAAPGTLVIFFPQDAHMPCLACGHPQPVAKVVVKVAVEAAQLTDVTDGT